MTPRHVAVVGGGYSGTLQAIELLRAGARVTLIERAQRLARGLAYGTTYPDHLLNVRASGMSAFAHEPDDFAAWFADDSGGQQDEFAPRRDYGRYLAERLERTRGEAGGRLRTVTAEVVTITQGNPGETVHLAGGGVVEADAAILAIGNLPPEQVHGIAGETLPAGIYVADPWAGDIAVNLSGVDTVLLIGTGLTAIDAALMLDSAGFTGRVVALSRRGLVPRPHAASPVISAKLGQRLEPDCASLLRYVRVEAEAGEWRATVDSLRPVTQSLWQASSVDERRRFLRHLRPWWDVHRHRIAPSIAARIDGMQRSGRLKIRAGKIISSSADGEQALVKWRPRGSPGEASLRVRRIVNCTGPQGDIGRAGDALVDSLIAAGRIRPDPCRIGIDVDAECRTLDSTGRVARSLYAIGPMTRSAFWEIVAVPDIRQQLPLLAARLFRARSGA